MRQCPHNTTYIATNVAIVATAIRRRTMFIWTIGDIIGLVCASVIALSFVWVFVGNYISDRKGENDE